MDTATNITNGAESNTHETVLTDRTNAVNEQLRELSLQLYLDARRYGTCI